MTNSLTTIDLPAQPTPDDVTGLLEQLCATVGTPVTLNAERVKLVSTLQLQVLMAAKTQWSSHGTPFSISSPSDGFLSGLTTLGLDHEHFDDEAVQ